MKNNHVQLLLRAEWRYEKQACSTHIKNEKVSLFLFLALCFATHALFASEPKDTSIVQYNKNPLSQEDLERIKKTPFQDHEAMFRNALKTQKAIACPALFTILMCSGTDQDINSIFAWLNDYPETLVAENVNVQNKNGSTLLHLYVKRPPVFYMHPLTQGFAKPPKIEKLFALNANMFMRDLAKHTAFALAVNSYNKFLNIGKTLSPRSAEISAMVGTKTCMNSYSSLLDKLVEEGQKKGFYQKPLASNQNT